MSDHFPDTTKMAPRRIQRNREKGWRAPAEPYTFVGRGTRWGNPWAILRRAGGWFCHDTHYGLMIQARDEADARDLAVSHYRAWVEPRAAEIRAELRGRTLMCWCPLDQPCHADVLLELANAPLRCEATDG